VNFSRTAELQPLATSNPTKQVVMADIEQQTPVEETPAAEDVEMGGDEAAADSAAGAGEETGLTEMEPEAPKLVLFAE
jgi:hypothetical protein